MWKTKKKAKTRDADTQIIPNSYLSNSGGCIKPHVYITCLCAKYYGDDDDDDSNKNDAHKCPFSGQKSIHMNWLGSLEN